MCDFGIGETAAAGTAAAAASTTSEVIAGIGVAASIASASMAAYSSYSSTEASNKAAGYQAAVASDQATEATQIGQVEAEQHDMEVKGLIGQQSAGYGGGGVDPNSGSALTVKSQTAGYGALDSLAIKQQAAQQAWGYQNQSTLDMGREVNAGGVAGTSLLQSSSSVGGSLLTATKYGVFD